MTVKQFTARKIEDGKLIDSVVLTIDKVTNDSYTAWEIAEGYNNSIIYSGFYLPYVIETVKMQYNDYDIVEDF